MKIDISKRDGTLFIADGESCVRAVLPTGVIRPFAGQCSNPGFSGDSGPASAAQLRGPTDLSLGADGSLYIADSLNHRIRKISANGTIQTIAGSGATGASAGSFTGDNSSATQATFNTPSGVDVGPDGVIYVADLGNGRVRLISPDGVVHTVAGTGVSSTSGNDGPGAAAGLGGPRRVRIATDGSLLIAETSGHVVRIRCAEPVLRKRVIRRHLRVHEGKNGSGVGGANRRMGSKRAVGDGICRG